MNRRYRVQEFAALAGVTVRTLQHYDRLGLLRPARTAAGYRLYADRDRDRLDQITALKFLGLRLRRIRQVLEGDTVPLVDALRVQRHALAAERDRLDRAIHVIERAERAAARAGASTATILEQLIWAIVRRETDAMRKYFSDAAWTAWQHHFNDWPPPPWRDLYQDVMAALGEDPCGARAEALLARTVALWQAETGGDWRLQREIHQGMVSAWRDRDNWPATLQQRFVEYRIREVAWFLARVRQLIFLNRGAAYFARFNASSAA